MKKIISFSLWGNNPKYTVGATKNAELAKEIYPGWIARFYVSKSVPKQVVDSLIKSGSEIVPMNIDGDCTGMFWRFLPANEKDVIMISRDTDSRLNFREKFAVDNWLSSGKSFHIMRDHPNHNTSILGGMWGARENTLKNIKEMIEDYLKEDFLQVPLQRCGTFYGLDQMFLKQKIYPIIKNNVCVHDEFFEKTLFPTKRIDYEFVGDVFDERDNRHPEYWKLLVPK